VLTIAQQLGDDRPCAKVYEFSVPLPQQPPAPALTHARPIPAWQKADIYAREAEETLASAGCDDYRDVILSALATAVLALRTEIRAWHEQQGGCER